MTLKSLFSPSDAGRVSAKRLAYAERSAARLALASRKSALGTPNTTSQLEPPSARTLARGNRKARRRPFGVSQAFRRNAPGV